MTAIEGNGYVAGALYSADALATATGILGRRILRIVKAEDLPTVLEDPCAHVLLFELGHPGYERLCTLAFAARAQRPWILLIPSGWIPVKEILTLSQAARFSVAYRHSELGVVLRQVQASGRAVSDAQRIAENLRINLPEPAALLGLGLYIAGVQNVTVAEAASRIGAGPSLRNRLRSLRMGRAATILGWAAALGIVWRLENERCSLATAARAAGFETTRQCSDRILYHTRRSPSTLRRAGFDALVPEFINVVAGRGFRSSEVRFPGDLSASFSYRVTPVLSHHGASHSRRNSWRYGNSF